MKLSKIKIKNYRLLSDAELEVDSMTTLIVGRNNTAKTSCFSCIDSVLKGKPFTFNDYPIRKRKKLYELIDQYMIQEIPFSELYDQLEPISLELVIDYSREKPDDDLGALSPFIIDVDENITTAIIRAEYRLKNDETNLRNILESNYNVEDKSISTIDRQKAILSNFERIFELKIYAVNPENQDEKQIKKLKELQDLFLLCIIPAERLLGEDGTQNNSLTGLISNFFDVQEEDLDPSIKDNVTRLRSIIVDANKDVQSQVDEILSELVSKAVGFGYPNGEELQLGVTTQLSIDDQIKSDSQLSYTADVDHESLPSNYNGLGYKNLIKIEFILAAFAQEVKNSGSACIPLLCIEEPESHMHPQMQQAFAT